MSDKIKCPYCDFLALNYNGLCKHVFKGNKHKNISKEQLLTDVKYNGVRPTCKCGCGEYTTIINTGGAHFADYIQGHWNKVNNNWGHNPKAIENSAKTRREQYRNGSRVQWNKNKKWGETYSGEIQEKLKNNLINKLHKRVEDKKFSFSSELELNFIKNHIKPLNSNYIQQYYIPEIKQFCDLYFPDKKLVIEINGTYWHCDKRIYHDGPINDTQKEKIKKDEIKYNYLKENGYNLLIIWEKDIKENLKEVKKNLKNKLINEQKRNI